MSHQSTSQSASQRGLLPIEVHSNVEGDSTVRHYRLYATPKVSFVRNSFAHNLYLIFNLYSLVRLLSAFSRQVRGAWEMQLFFCLLCSLMYTSGGVRSNYLSNVMCEKPKRRKRLSSCIIFFCIVLLRQTRCVCGKKVAERAIKMHFLMILIDV